jgi:hypothetical protein
MHRIGSTEILRDTYLRPRGKRRGSSSTMSAQHTTFQDMPGTMTLTQFDLSYMSSGEVGEASVNGGCASGSTPGTGSGMEGGASSMTGENSPPLGLGRWDDKKRADVIEECDEEALSQVLSGRSSRTPGHTRRGSIVDVSLSAGIVPGMASVDSALRAIEEAQVREDWERAKAAEAGKRQLQMLDKLVLRERMALKLQGSAAAKAARRAEEARVLEETAERQHTETCEAAAGAAAAQKARSGRFLGQKKKRDLQRSIIQADAMREAARVQRLAAEAEAKEKVKALEAKKEAQRRAEQILIRARAEATAQQLRQKELEEQERVEAELERQRRETAAVQARIEFQKRREAELETQRQPEREAAASQACREQHERQEAAAAMRGEHQEQARGSDSFAAAEHQQESDAAKDQLSAQPLTVCGAEKRHFVAPTQEALRLHCEAAGWNTSKSDAQRSQLTPSDSKVPAKSVALLGSERLVKLRNGFSPRLTTGGTVNADTAQLLELPGTVDGHVSVHIVSSSSVQSAAGHDGVGGGQCGGSKSADHDKRHLDTSEHVFCVADALQKDSSKDAAVRATSTGGTWSTGQGATPTTETACSTGVLSQSETVGDREYGTGSGSSISSRVAAFDSMAEASESGHAAQKGTRVGSMPKWSVDVRYVRTPALRTASVCISSSSNKSDTGSPLSLQPPLDAAGSDSMVHRLPASSCPAKCSSDRIASAVALGTGPSEMAVNRDCNHDGNGFPDGNSPLAVIINSFSESKLSFEQQQKLLSMYNRCESMLPGVPRAAIEQGLIEATDLPEGFLSKAAALRDRRQQHLGLPMPRSLPAPRVGSHI